MASSSSSTTTINRAENVEFDIPLMDELVEEYLVYRGFPQTWKSFRNDRRNDRTKGLRATKVVESLISCINSFSYEELIDQWGYLSETYFVKVDNKDALILMKKLELQLKRFFIINCVNKKNIEKVKEFFERNAENLLGDPEWKEWFVIAYVKNPMSHPYFKQFFTKTWLDAFLMSLTNFLSTVFHNMPLPKLLDFNLERTQRKQLETEIKKLQKEIEVLKIERRRQITSPVRINTKSQTSDDPNISPNNFSQPFAIPSRSTQQSVSIVNNMRKSALSDLSDKEHPNPFIQQSQEVYNGHAAAITKCKFSPNGQEIASASNDGVVKVWSLTGITRKQSSLFCTTEILSLLWADKVNNMLLIGTDDGKVKVWNPFAEKMLAELTTAHPRVLDICSNLYSTSIMTASTSSGHSSGSLCNWNMKTFQITEELPIDPATVTPNCVSFNHNGSMLAVGGSDGMIRIYDMSTCSAIMGWNAHDAEVLSVQFSDDETSIFSMGKDNKLINSSIHNIGKTLQSYSYEGFLKGTNKSADIAFEGSGQFFAVGSKSNRAVLYKVDSNEPAQIITGHTSPVVAVDWSKNLEGNSFVITGSLDQTVRLTELS